MKSIKSNKQEGFTIIEVLIVLAIAALIMAIVFYAVPQLRKSSNDNARRALAARVSSELQNYASNNQGSLPTAGTTGAWQWCSALTGTGSCADWKNRYITNGNVNITDPNGNTESIAFASAATAPSVTWAANTMWVDFGGDCSGEGFTTGNGGNQSYAILIALEKSRTFYCISSQ